MLFPRQEEEETFGRGSSEREQVFNLRKSVWRVAKGRILRVRSVDAADEVRWRLLLLVLDLLLRLSISYRRCVDVRRRCKKKKGARK